MNTPGWWLNALACCSMLCVCGLAACQGPGGLDAETWEELRRGIEQRYPNADPELKREMLRRIELTPKLRCSIEAVTVYTDGMVYRATLNSELPFDSRVSLDGWSLSLIHRAQLTDRSKNEWGVPRSKSCYLFAPLTVDRTILVPRGETVRFVQVEALEAPRLVRRKPREDDRPEKPPELHYRIIGYLGAYTLELMDRKQIYLIGRGKASVEWKDVPIPTGTKTEVVDPKGRPGK